MDIEMNSFTHNGNDAAPHSSNGPVTASNTADVTCRASEATETDSLLTVQVSASNGQSIPSSPTGIQKNAHTPTEPRTISNIRRELNEVVFWKVKMWMVIAFILLLILLVIIISVALCSAIHRDPDETFDPSLFKVPVYFNGSFLLPNLALKEEQVTSNYSNQSLSADLQNKLADLYRYSPALGRYFSKAEIRVLWNSSVTADYQLKFLMPEEQQDALRNFTLSREMVYNVFRQFLYDQEPGSSEPLYINPRSLKMF
ncbi:TPA-induced transmembrane protein homolog [Echeneis naucrates]|uniref:SEA domain-containing protein n=1 Tax=Echeneis naucrates TaxID=173247 RepID=A0A665TVG3_ECHNA|nr:TPA-induced transmembrane protein [Echeneis naucrates]